MSREDEAFDRATLDSIDALIVVLDGDGLIIAANAAIDDFAAEHDCGLHVGANYLNLCEAAGDRGRVAIARSLREMLAGDVPSFSAHYELQMPGDALRWFGVRATRFAGEGRGRIVLRIFDSTEFVRAQRSAHLRARLLDEIDAAVVSASLDGTIEVWSRGAEDLFGWKAAEMRGRNALEVILAPEDLDRGREGFAALRATGARYNEFALRRKDGSMFASFSSSVVYRDDDGEPAGVIGVMIDATERVKAASELRQARDHLRAVTDSMGEALCTLDHAGRVSYMNAAAERVLGYSFEDLRGYVLHDAIHFRRPDGRPHPLGESLLMGGHRARTSVRVEEDTFVRADGCDVPVSYVLAPFESAEGDGSVIVFSDISGMKAERQRLRAEIERLEHVRDLHEALDEQRFELYAQPIIDLDTGLTISHELLLRMRERDGTIRLPGTFLPAAERSGMIRELDRWVIGEACRLAGDGHRVELNLSAASLGDPELYDDFAAVIADAGADPGLIGIELTETALMQDETMAAAFVTRIGALGCELALDDFGTGFGGFGYLKNLPVDYLKIDIEFVRDLRTNLASRHVVQAVVGLAGSFGHKTVAEGVEDDATLAMIREMGVDYAQGYGIGRPGPLQDTLYVAT